MSMIAYTKCLKPDNDKLIYIDIRPPPNVDVPYTFTGQDWYEVVYVLSAQCIQQESGLSSNVVPNLLSLMFEK